MWGRNELKDLGTNKIAQNLGNRPNENQKERTLVRWNIET